MQANIMRTLVEYIAELKRRNRNHNGTGQQPSINTEGKISVNWNKGNGSRDGGRSKNQSR